MIFPAYTPGQGPWTPATEAEIRKLMIAKDDSPAAYRKRATLTGAGVGFKSRSGGPTSVVHDEVQMRHRRIVAMVARGLETPAQWRAAPDADGNECPNDASILVAKGKIVRVRRGVYAMPGAKQ